MQLFISLNQMPLPEENEGSPNVEQEFGSDYSDSYGEDYNEAPPSTLLPQAEVGLCDLLQSLVFL